MSKSGEYQIPFHPVTGDLMGYPESVWVGVYPNSQRSEPKWRDNFEFNDVMTYRGYARGRSSALILLTGENGREFPVFMSEFDKIAPHMVYGKIRGRFTFCKKGKNYGLKLVKTS